jgi:hypothetical protein
MNHGAFSDTCHFCLFSLHFVLGRACADILFLDKSVLGSVQALTYDKCTGRYDMRIFSWPAYATTEKVPSYRGVND